MAEARFIMQNRRPNFSVYQTLPQFFKKSFSEIFRGIGMHIPRNICIALSKTNLYADAFDNSWAKTHRLNWCLYILRAEHLLPDLGLPFPHGSKTPWMHGKNILYLIILWLEQIERGPSFKHRVQGFLPCLQKNIRWRRSPRFLSRIYRLYTCCNFIVFKNTSRLPSGWVFSLRQLTLWCWACLCLVAPINLCLKHSEEHNMTRIR